ncbi:RHS repeat-associated core domain-containing protein [Burkholderia cepacia]|uniref:RHS repeat-associated core domain-containing protein n=1 Tax=Burkholderia cepacia TaxID=292 RepID=UPI00075D04C6|nr:RHS repeat-associated core domain-containing protein [Burkholderia cepacia]KVW88252.1 hypothetical protein WL00_13555 [Burkholderia cepacia]KVX73772.1 hypothetical protein WL07_11435 [Burkholderia cepacia]
MKRFPLCYEYDPRSGHLSSTVDGQRITAYRFDERGRLIERRAALQIGESIPRVADWQVERFAYDGNGNLALASNAASRLQWFHDAAGNLMREHQHYRCLGKPLVAVWLHEYDALNQRIATVRPDGHRVSWLTCGSGHLVGLQLDDHELVSYERDDLHREVARLQGNRLLQTQQWDALGRLSEQVLARDSLKGPQGQTDGGRLLVRRYRYDAASQLTGINDTRRGQLTYRYDPVGQLLEAQSRLGTEIFAFDPAGNLIDPAEQREAERQRMPSPKALDNLLKQYAGTHYQYDARGNLSKRWHNGKESRYTWDLFDRLTHYEDERLQADYSYDALGRRLTKYSKAHYEERREAGPHWNRAERVKRNRELQCGFTLYGWDGDTLAWESKIADEDGFGARTTHYVYEPGSFVPVAQAVRQDAIELPDQPEYGDYYRQDEDPLWLPPPPPPPINSLAWYQCDHLGTPQELTDEQSEIAWAAEYRAWGVVKEALRKASDSRVERHNPIRFQGQYHDRETGLHYNRYRYYDPEVGRFVGRDPIGYAGGINVYEFGPNPNEYLDPLGLTAAKLKTNLERAGRPVLPGQTPHHIVQENCRKGMPNSHVQKSREILERSDIGIDSASNGAVLWGASNTQVAAPGHPGRAGAASNGNYHAGRHVHSALNDKLIYQVLKGVEKRGGNVENALKDLGRRLESGSWKATFDCCCD